MFHVYRNVKWKKEIKVVSLLKQVVHKYIKMFYITAGEWGNTHGRCVFCLT